MKLKKFEAATFLAFVMLLLLSVLTFENDCKDIRKDCFRLHIIANSDSAEDQLLKLQVRDNVLEKTADMFSEADNKAEAIALCEKEAETIKAYATEVIKNEKLGYDVKIETGKAYFPTRTYESYTLPAGEYDALKIIIGEGKGKNWWCVMFPSLCLPTFVKEDRLSDVLTEDEISLIEKSPKYEIRFWIVEKLQELRKGRVAD